MAADAGAAAVVDEVDAEIEHCGDEDAEGATDISDLAPLNKRDAERQLAREQREIRDRRNARLAELKRAAEERMAATGAGATASRLEFLMKQAELFSHFVHAAPITAPAAGATASSAPAAAAGAGASSADGGKRAHHVMTEKEEDEVRACEHGLQARPFNPRASSHAIFSALRCRAHQRCIHCVSVLACARRPLFLQELVAEAQDTAHQPVRLTSQPTIIAHGTMREYQLEGLNWMINLHDNSISGILADEMGLGMLRRAQAPRWRAAPHPLHSHLFGDALCSRPHAGKTLQSISLLAYLKEYRKVGRRARVFACAVCGCATRAQRLHNMATRLRVRRCVYACR
ncbi:MAG: hypothetical protein EOO41_01685 [Methanobacteriota archaeon]|nr:MAG: hypothetical protein EOO41_01685 [Euryarchaeota archaeon]